MHDGRRPRYPKVEPTDIYNLIQQRLNDVSLEYNTLQTYIEEIQFNICNYINRGYVPEPLKFVWLNMTLDLLKSEAMNGVIENDKLGDVSIGALASIKDGDTELKLATSSSSKNSVGAHVGDVDSLIYNYKTQLDKFRVNKW